MMNVRSLVLLSLCFVLLTFEATPWVYCQEKIDTNLYVIYVDGIPQDIAFGDKVTIIFNVVYYNRTLYCGCISWPAIGLKSASLLLFNGTASTTLSNVIIYPTKVAGQYTVTLEFKPDYPTGKVTIYVDENSLSTVIGNLDYSGPPSPVSSTETDDRSDDSIVQLVTPTPTPSPFEVGASPWVLPLILIIVVIGAILVYLGFKVSRKRE